MSGYLLEEHAREVIGQSEHWKAWLYEVKDSPCGRWFEVTGAVVPLKLKGKNKGQPNWKLKDRATIQTVAFSVDDHNQWLEKWKQRTGLCYECNGTGQQFWRWSAETGKEYRPCPRCHGAGRSDGGEGAIVSDEQLSK